MKDTKRRTRRAPSPLPLNAIWLDAAAAGAMLDYDARSAREKIVARPDFPKPTPCTTLSRIKRWRCGRVGSS